MLFSKSLNPQELVPIIPFFFVKCHTIWGKFIQMADMLEPTSLHKKGSPILAKQG
jgi:hypothetical protein